MALYASNDWKTWWQANTIDMVEEQFKEGPGGHTAGFHHTPAIETYACIGTPGYVYLMGCVVEGYVKTHLWSADGNKPPFENCIQLQGLCGASCESGVLEPAYNDPDSWYTFHNKHYMHCVADPCTDCYSHSKSTGLRVDYDKWSDVDRKEPNDGTARGCRAHEQNPRPVPEPAHPAG